MKKNTFDKVPSNKEGKHHVMLRMPLKLFEQLKIQANVNRRSVGAEAIVILEQYIGRIENNEDLQRRKYVKRINADSSGKSSDNT